MKIQDIGFIIVFIFLLIMRKSRLSIIIGLLCLLLAIPLFSAWIFFTGERMVWYGAAFILIGIIMQLFQAKSHT